MKFQDKGDRLQLEEKDQIRKRLGRSCDLGDAIALTWAQPVHKEHPELQRLAGRANKPKPYHMFDLLRR